MMAQAIFQIRSLALCAAMAAMAGCTGLDTDFRGITGGFATTAPDEGAPTLARPDPDPRGVISYPSYQVVVAEQGETVTSASSR